MAHGTPDWWGESPTVTVHQVTDLGELAARLGSPDTYDRRGNVVWLDSFEGGRRRVHTTVGGTGALTCLSAYTARSGAFSMKLVNGSDGARMADLYHSVHPVVLSKVGFEFSWASLFNDQYVSGRIDYYDGSNQYAFVIRYDEALDKLQYLDSGGNYQDLETSLALSRMPFVYHTLKIVADLEEGEYQRVLLNSEEWSLEGVACRTSADATEQEVRVKVATTGEAGENHYIYLDDLIITQNEP